MDIRRYPELTSTSTQAAALGDSAAHGTVVVTDCQTAGRGQRGISWEAEPGKNLSFSIVLRPKALPPRRQYELSMVMALALHDVLERYIPGHAVCVKWPNDIYVDNGKISGTIIECSLGSSGIERAIVGIGININQTVFVSDAPNPVSVKMFTGHDYDLEALLAEFCTAVIDGVDAHCRAIDPSLDAVDDPAAIALLDRYHACLWRNDGRPHQWLDIVTGHLFTALIDHVAPDGLLTLRCPSASSLNPATTP